MLISLGLDFRHADLITREAFHIDADRVAGVYADLDPLEELVLVPTCNRVEAYAWAPDLMPELAAKAVARLWTGDDLGARRLLDVARVRRGHEAARHLFHVSAGLESQVLGDIHIVGQLRRAYRGASETGAAGPYLHRLFDLALRTGKRVKTETRLMQGRTSVGDQAASHALRHLEDPASSRCVVVGCGKTGAHAARTLAEAGVREIIVMNRSPERAESLAEEVGATVVSADRLYEELARSDLGVLATSAGRQIVAGEALARALGAGPRRPLLLMDLSVPRNVSRDVSEIDGVRLVDLDALNPAAASVERERVEAARDAREIASEQLDEFNAWLEKRRISQALGPLRDMLLQLCEREIGHIAPADEAGRVASRIVAKTLAAPIESVLSEARGEQALRDLAGTMSWLFPTGDAAARTPAAPRGASATRGPKAEVAGGRRDTVGL